MTDHANPAQATPALPSEAQTNSPRFLAMRALYQHNNQRNADVLPFDLERYERITALGADSPYNTQVDAVLAALHSPAPQGRDETTTGTESSGAVTGDLRAENAS